MNGRILDTLVSLKIELGDLLDQIETYEKDSNNSYDNDYDEMCQNADAIERTIEYLANK